MNLDVLERGRRRAEERMTATCTITRPGEKVWNAATLQYDTPTVTVYDGICRLKEASSQSQDDTAGDQSFAESGPELHLPVETSGDVAKNDRVTVTGSVEDADLIGRVFTVDFVPAYSQGTARRIPVTETQ